MKKNKIMLYFLFKFSFLNSTATIMTLSGCDKCSCWIWIVHLTNTAECSIMLCFGLVYSCRKWKAEVAAQLCSWWSAWWCFPASAARSMGSHWQMYVFDINGFTESSGTVAVLSVVCKQLVKFSDLVTWVLICCFRVLCCLSHLEHSALWCVTEDCSRNNSWTSSLCGGLYLWVSCLKFGIAIRCQSTLLCLYYFHVIWNTPGAHF